MRLTKSYLYSVHGSDGLSVQSRLIPAYAPGQIRSSRLHLELPSNQNSNLALVVQSNVGRVRTPVAPAIEKSTVDEMLRTENTVELLKVDLQDAVRDGNLGLAEQLADEISQLEWI